MTVEFYGRITEYTNGVKLFTPKIHPTIDKLLNELSSHFGDKFTSFINSNEACLILVNSKGIALTGGQKTPLNEGDKIEILPFVEAG